LDRIIFFNHLRKLVERRLEGARKMHKNCRKMQENVKKCEFLQEIDKKWEKLEKMVKNSRDLFKSQIPLIEG